MRRTDILPSRSSSTHVLDISQRRRIHRYGSFGIALIVIEDERTVACGRRTQEEVAILCRADLRTIKTTNRSFHIQTLSGRDYNLAAFFDTGIQHMRMFQIYRYRRCDTYGRKLTRQ